MDSQNKKPRRVHGNMYYNNKKPHYELVYILPHFNYGYSLALMFPLISRPPIYQYCRTRGSIQGSIGFLARTILTPLDQKIGPAGLGSFIDVRDAALGHVRALTAPDAPEQRYILAGGVASHKLVRHYTLV
jgi:hypothetical protein